MSAPFAKISQGPPSTTGFVTSPDSLFLDRQNNVCGSSGDANDYNAFQTALQILQAQTALTNVTTAQTLYTWTPSAGFLNLAGRVLSLSGFGIYTFAGGSTPSITFTLKYGATTLATIVTGPLNTAASTNMPFDFQFIIGVATTGATGSMEVHGDVDINLSANTPAGVMSYFRDVNTAAIASLNLTTAQALTLQVSSGNAITSIQLRLSTLELLS